MSPPLTRVAVYRRTIAASLERVRENVHDWEHLPWLHSESFSSIELLEQGDWGWRARVAGQPAGTPPSTLELRFDPGGLRYVARSTDSERQGAEIWTTLEPQGDQRTAIEVEFWAPDVRPGREDALGAAYTKLYAKLWDEDEQMMQLRDARLRPRLGTRASTLDLGPLAELRSKLPLCVEWGGRPFRVVEHEGALRAHATICPHRLGPLDRAEIEDGGVRCPWHGYWFDLESGRCRDGAAGLRLETPCVEIDADTERVRLVRGRPHRSD